MDFASAIALASQLHEHEIRRLQETIAALDAKLDGKHVSWANNEDSDGSLALASKRSLQKSSCIQAHGGPLADSRLAPIRSKDAVDPSAIVMATLIDETLHTQPLALVSPRDYRKHGDLPADFCAKMKKPSFGNDQQEQTAQFWERLHSPASVGTGSGCPPPAQPEENSRNSSEQLAELSYKLDQLMDLQSRGTEHRSSVTSQRVSSYRDAVHGKEVSLRSGTMDTVDFMEVSETIKSQSGIYRSLISRNRYADAAWTFLSNPDSSRTAYVYKAAMNPLILASVAFSLLQSIDPPLLTGTSGTVIEASIDALLSIDIIMRFLCCPNRLMFFRSAYNIIDLVYLAVLAFRCLLLYHTISNHVIIQGPSISIALIGLSPALRLLKLLRRFEKFHLILRAFQEAFDALPVLLYTLTVIWLFFSAFLFFVESRENLEQLPTSLWLTIVTMGTVGYGDLAPKEPVGKLITTVIIIVSALYMSIPVGIIGNAFNRIWEQREILLVIERVRSSLAQLGYRPSDVQLLITRCGAKAGGELTFRSFKRMMTTIMKLHLPDDQVMQLFETIDRDGGGTIDADEFLRVVFPDYFFEVYDRDSESDGADSVEIEDKA